MIANEITIQNSNKVDLSNYKAIVRQPCALQQ